MSTIHYFANRFSPSRPLLTRSIIVLLALGGFAGIDANAPTCRHAFVAGTDSHIRLKNYMGSIEVRSGEKDRIVVTADVSDDCIRADKKGNMIEIAAVKEKGIRPINFVVSIPASCAVTLEGYKCKITVHDVQGDLEVSTHEGDIDLYKIHSDSVKVNSINGRIMFDGDILANGLYTFDSLNNIDLFLPKDASFDVLATSDHDHIDLGGFGLVDSGSGKRIAGRHGNGGAKMKVTSEGTIHFHRR
ncbi:MAG TPA: hypothetical protein VFC63_17115 [Blastocatellia bacterium]|nr:hypothetical protein [Blastocatellia bacterium]